MIPVTIVDRYTAREFTGPFLAAVAGFTVMLLSGLLFELTDLIVDKKMPVSTIVQMLIYKLPGVVVVSLPIAVLFATLLALGRLIKDSELIILLGTGTPFTRVIVPFFVAAALVSAGAFLLNERIVPESNHRAESLFRQSLFQDPLPTVREGVFFRGADDRFFYVGEVNRRERTMKRILIYQLGDEAYPQMITAERGTCEERVWHLEDGIRKRLDERGFTLEDSAFAKLEYPMTEDLDTYLGNQKSTDEMTREELKRHIELFKRSGLDVKRFEVAYHMKASLPMAGLLWTLVGAPLSMRSTRSGRFYGVVISIGVAFLYFVLSSLFRSLGGSGVLPPLVAAWLTNLLYAFVGTFLLYRVDR